MNEPPVHGLHANNGGLKGIPWGLIPALTFAAFLSGVLGELIWLSSMELFQSDTVFTLLASVSFALALGAVLWFYGLIPDYKRLAAVVGVTVATHLLGLLGELHLPGRMRDYADYPVLGSVEPLVLVTSSAVGLILYIALLTLTRPRCAIGWVVLIAFVCSSFGGATIAAVDATQQGKWFALWHGQALLLLWQLALAFFLGIALTLKGVWFVSHVPIPQKQPRALLRRRLAVFGAFASYFVAMAVLFCLSPFLHPNAPPKRVDVPVKKLTIDASDMEQRLVYRVEPVYPPTARQARIEGAVTFTVLIGADGSVRQLTVDKGHPLLVPAALDAVRQWRYEPVVSEGNPVEVMTRVSVIFQLKKPENRSINPG